MEPQLYEQAAKRMKLGEDQVEENINKPMDGIDKEDDEFSYGYLIVLGHASYLLADDKTITPKSVKNQRFVLKRRPIPNGIKELEERELSLSSAQTIVPELYRTQGSTHSLSICWGSERRGFIEYNLDENSDMFQFGRATTNDFILPGLITNKGPTMSRYAFRIQCERSPPYSCRIIAGGFDDSNQLFVGEGALAWSFPKKDAFVTNGVRVIYNTLSKEEERSWHEVSCRGASFTARHSYKVRGMALKEVDNTLHNGSLISVGGITLMWVSNHNDLDSTWDRYQLQAELNRRRVQCPVQLSTIYFGSIELSPADSSVSRAWIYPSCGHVHGFNPELLNNERCTICRQSGVYTELKIESNEVLKAFSSTKPTHVLNPCGHAIDLNGAQLWSTLLQLMQDDAIYQKASKIACPFCRTLLDIVKPYSKLIYQTDSEEDN